MRKNLTCAYHSSCQWLPPAEIRGIQINFDWQLLNFLWLDVIDERDRTALQYQRDLRHDEGGTWYLLKMLSSFIHHCQKQRCLLEAYSLFLIHLQWLVIMYLLFCGCEFG